MKRSCSMCGSVKEGPEAVIDPMTSENLAKFWKSMHKPGCPYQNQDAPQRLNYFMENGSPVSSVEE